MAEQPEQVRARALAGIPHAFLTAIGDDAEPEPDAVEPGAALVTVKQVHSPLAICVDAPFAPGERPDADALATATPGLVLGIVTADCAPVLLADAEAGVVGAAHAGWRGAHGGVIEAVVAAMEQLGARRHTIAAAIGPTIAQASYEVDAAFRDRFVGQYPAANDLFTPGRAGHAQFDLPGFVSRQLAQSGVSAVEDLALDTYADPHRFHSFRRATHRGEPTGGRQYSLIARRA